ncbi:CLUMA_CG010479, isoform A [Clunio marinus]|uniref:CLUMA_CG010479, isoform A n=1 Tax=Clunio marinus TaxID=568069 RepID=A0A1J1I9V1_9DIPT|nr:CLUMA_CG010479, isoform A [Clunio marinus]
MFCLLGFENFGFLFRFYEMGPGHMLVLRKTFQPFTEFQMFQEGIRGFLCLIPNLLFTFGHEIYEC